MNSTLKIDFDQGTTSKPKPVTGPNDLLLMLVQHWGHNESVFTTEDGRRDFATGMLFSSLIGIITLAIGLIYCKHYCGGAGERATMVANRHAFMQWKIVPRMLRPTGKRDLHIELFGETYIQSIFYSDKETDLAQVCAETGVPYILSTASTSTIEVAAASTGPKWFQLYWPKDHSITKSLLSRAKSQGYKVLVVTLDTWTLAWRPADLDGGYIPFVKGLGNQIGFSDPVFRARIASKYEWLQGVFSGSSQGWEDLKLLREAWDGPIVLKGIQHPDDAKLAVAASCNGIIVSNHGGRQLDGAVRSLDMLPEIVEAVGDKITVLFDSGIRTGADIIKALSLGAKAVLVARPVIYGFAIAGRRGQNKSCKGCLQIWTN
ncbi:FMN-dependent dehydrogenase-domain-containing protein [Leptodontidium sp. MPI-SDFR-AT-0119]|nr:FMN-dependent dehydrogenase-domain-containing protein [Leptodontidium sp. MPI-SDFR-AT-0119]